MPFGLVGGAAEHLLCADAAVCPQAPAAALPLIHDPRLEHTEAIRGEVQPRRATPVAERAGKGPELQAAHHAPQHRAHG